MNRLNRAKASLTVVELVILSQASSYTLVIATAHSTSNHLALHKELVEMFKVTSYAQRFNLLL